MTSNPPRKPHRHLTRDTPDTAALAPKGPPTPGEMRTQTITSDGRERRFVLYVPRGHDGRSKLPLVLNLHGSTSYPEEQMLLSEMAPAADRHGVAVLAPEALDRAWNVPEGPDDPSDVTFIADAIAATEALIPLSPGRRFATGFSGGGRMLALLAARLPEPLLAIAPVSGLRFPEKCTLARKPTVIAFHGTLDRVNPYDGGGFPYWQTSVEHAAEAWARHNGVLLQGRSTLTAPDVTHTVYGDGPHRVELYRIDNLGHIWAGFPVPLGDLFDPPNKSVQATEVMLTAFAKL